MKRNKLSGWRSGSLDAREATVWFGAASSSRISERSSLRADKLGVAMIPAAELVL